MSIKGLGEGWLVGLIVIVAQPIKAKYSNAKVA